MTGLVPAHPDQPDECPGVRIVSLEINPASALVVVLSEELGCPACGRKDARWEVPAFQDRMFHYPNTRPDPGE